MTMTILLALAASTATPTTKPSGTTPPVVAESKAKPDPMQAFAGMMVMFDKIFPSGPEPDPARLAAARDLTMTMFPAGTYGRSMSKFVESTADRVLDMSEADLAAMFPEPKPAKGKKAKVPSTEPLRIQMAKKDPNFDATVAAMKAFAGTMLVKMGDVAEPKFREGMSRSLARKFDAQQLAEIRAFLATPTGAAYGREMVGLWFQPDVIRGSLQAFPEMMKLMPELAKDGAAFERAMKKSRPADKKN